MATRAASRPLDARSRWCWPQCGQRDRPQSGCAGPSAPSARGSGYRAKNVFLILSSLCSMVSSLHFETERLPVQIQAMRFCTGGACARIFFFFSAAKPSFSSRHGDLPPRGQLLLFLLTLDCTNSGTLVETPPRAFFCQTYASSGRPNLMSL